MNQIWGQKERHYKANLSGISSGKERGYFFSRGREADSFHADWVITPGLLRAGGCSEAISVFPQPNTMVG